MVNTCFWNHFNLWLLILGELNSIQNFFFFLVMGEGQFFLIVSEVKIVWICTSKFVREGASWNPIKVELCFHTVLPYFCRGGNGVCLKAIFVISLAFYLQKDRYWSLKLKLISFCLESHNNENWLSCSLLYLCSYNMLDSKWKSKMLSQSWK